MIIYKPERRRRDLCFGASPEKQVAFLNQIFPISSKTRILDIGCGCGHHLKRLASQTPYVFGLDRNDCRVPQAKTFRCDFFAEALPIEICNIHLAYIFSPYFGDNWTRLDNLAVKIAERLWPSGKLVLDLFHFASLPSGYVNWRLQRKRGIRVRTLCARSGDTYFEFDLQNLYGRNFEISKQKRWPIFSEGNLKAQISKSGLHIERVCSDFDLESPGVWHPITSPPFPRLVVILQKPEK